MDTSTFSKLEGQSPEIHERCHKVADQPGAREKGWTPEIVWKKAQATSQICHFSYLEAGLEFIESQPASLLADLRASASNSA